jgi:hypothetical protein
MAATCCRSTLLADVEAECAHPTLTALPCTDKSYSSARAA